MSRSVVDGLWKDQRRPLLRLGSKGVQPSHLNSLRELMAAHPSVRVKVNGAAWDVLALAESMMAPKDGEEMPLGVVLRVKAKEFLVTKVETVEALIKEAREKL